MAPNDIPSGKQPRDLDGDFWRTRYAAAMMLLANLRALSREVDAEHARPTANFDAVLKEWREAYRS